jgi:hypothetical protein
MIVHRHDLARVHYVDARIAVAEQVLEARAIADECDFQVTIAVTHGT